LELQVESSQSCCAAGDAQVNFLHHTPSISSNIITRVAVQAYASAFVYHNSVLHLIWKYGLHSGGLKIII
jgi:hypothetical protein